MPCSSSSRSNSPSSPQKPNIFTKSSASGTPLTANQPDDTKGEHVHRAELQKIPFLINSRKQRRIDRIANRPETVHQHHNALIVKKPDIHREIMPSPCLQDEPSDHPRQKTYVPNNAEKNLPPARKKSFVYLYYTGKFCLCQEHLFHLLQNKQRRYIYLLTTRLSSSQTRPLYQAAP